MARIAAEHGTARRLPGAKGCRVTRSPPGAGAAAREFRSGMSLVTFALWFSAMVLPSYVLFGVAGVLLFGTRGLLLTLGAVGVAHILLGMLVRRAIARPGAIRIRTDADGLALEYMEVRKFLRWSDILQVRRTRSLLWKDLIELRAESTRIILNLHLQPERREILRLLKRHVPADRLAGFRWEDLAAGR